MKREEKGGRERGAGNDELAFFFLFFLFFRLTIFFFPISSKPTSRSSSYGVVYLAIDRQTGEEVAVKAMSKRRPKSTRERTLKKLVREAALQARVQHCSGVVKLLGAYEVRIDRFFSFLSLRSCSESYSRRVGSGRGG